MSLILSVFVEILKGLSVWAAFHFSPSEIKRRREIKKEADTKEAKRDLNNAIKDESLGVLAGIITERLHKRMRSENYDPEGFRKGFASIGLKIPSGNDSGGKQSGEESPS